MSKVCSIVNQKGGVGKTTTAVNLGAALAQQGQKVLRVYNDSQADLIAHPRHDNSQCSSAYNSVIIPVQHSIYPLKV